VVGVILLTHSQAGFFDDDAMRLLSTLGAEVATAIHNAELYSYINDQALRLSEMLTYQQEEASKVRSILQSIADGVIVVDRAGLILMANPAAQEILGMRREDLEGRNTRDLPGLFMGGGILAQDTQRFELVDRFVNVHSAQVVMDTGEVLGRVYVLRDITKEVEADRSKSEFISTVSHELRTPLTSIKGYVDLILLGSVGEVTPMQRSFLDVVRANSNRLVDLINDILDISRVETGRIVLNLEPIAIGELVEEVTESARAEIERKSLSLDVQLPPDLPLVQADRKRIVQVLNNMVSNAYKYTREGGHISVVAGCSDGYLRVSVTDSGVGISPDDMKKLFTRFFRADNPLRDEVGGTGLGLAISKSFIELHGGAMGVESEVDVGSTFFFTLPLMPREEMLTEKEAEAITAEATGGSVGGRAPLILVVDDEPNILDLLRYQLERAGYTVRTARRGEEALTIARRERPDLITLDMLMAGMDGSEVLERLKSDGETADIPVVIISIVADRENLMAMGAVDFLPKPLEEIELLMTVERVLSRVLQGKKIGTVLVGDDDPDIVGWLRRVLEDKGFKVREAGDGEAVLEAVLQSPPDLILLDLRMPKLDGREVITRLKLRSDTRDIPIIVITASSVDKERDRVQILGMGAEGFLTKPFPAEDLVREIGLVLSKKMEATKE
jgi:signal transduction histidine kinase/DNA-binding response OmpR family regulator